MAPLQSKISVLVLMGGYTSEFGISIKSGTVVCEELDREKYQVYPCVVTKDQWFYQDANSVKHEVDPGNLSINLGDKRIHPDVVFNTIHGSPGEDGHIASLCALLEVPQTSTHFYAAALSFNKRDCLSVLKVHGIPCAESIYCDKNNTPSFKEVQNKLGLPFFVKPNRSGSSYGVSMVNAEIEYEQALNTAFAEDHQILIERALKGIEVSVGAYAFDGEVIILTPTEIVSENAFFDLSAKYEGKAQEITPARINDQVTLEVQKLVRKIYTTLEMNGACRADFIIEEGQPFFIELNSTPGLSKESLIPQQAKYSGISLSEFFDRLITEAITNHKKNHR
jgi:D-alanine-D-alanine ligase